MRRVGATLRNITRNPLEAIGYVLAGALLLAAIYLFSPLYQGPAEGLAPYGVGIFYLATGLPYVVRGMKSFPYWITTFETNLLFVGHLFTTLVILISVGLTPLYWVWSAVCTITALIVHLWVARSR